MARPSRLTTFALCVSLLALASTTHAAVKKPSPKPPKPSPKPPKPSPKPPKPPPPPKPLALITCIYAATSVPVVATVAPTQLAGTFPACANATFDVVVPSLNNFKIKVSAWFQVPAAPATGCGPACCKAASLAISAVVIAEAKKRGVTGVATLTSNFCCRGTNNCNYFPMAGRKLMAEEMAAGDAPSAAVRALREAGVDLFAGLQAQR